MFALIGAVGTGACAIFLHEIICGAKSDNIAKAAMGDNKAVVPELTPLKRTKFSRQSSTTTYGTKLCLFSLTFTSEQNHLSGLGFFVQNLPTMAHPQKCQAAFS